LLAHNKKASGIRAKAKWPWFIILFLLAAWLGSLLPAGQPFWDGIAAVARTGFSVTLFLIGAGLSVQGLKKLGGGRLLKASRFGLPLLPSRYY
jgi:uncharacterized membrane protein YadS